MASDINSFFIAMIFLDLILLTLCGVATGALYEARKDKRIYIFPALATIFFLVMLVLIAVVSTLAPDSTQLKEILSKAQMQEVSK